MALRLPSLLLVGLLLVTFFVCACGARDCPIDPPEPPTQAELTSSIRARLQAKDVESAATLYSDLVTRFDARGLTAGGARLPPSAMAGAIFDEALAAARARIEGAAPDLPSALRALEVASRLVSDTEDDEAEARLSRAERWVTRERATDLSTTWPPHDGPRVVVYADDFELGEPILPSVLKRWAEEGKTGGLQVLLVPVITGNVRMGIRRVPAKDLAEEQDHLLARLTGTGIVASPTPFPLPDAIDTLGLDSLGAAVLVFDRSGRLAVRLSGRSLDPRPLETVVQRVASR